MKEYVPASDEKVEEAIDLVRKKKALHSNVALLSVVRDNNLTELIGNTACHAGLSYGVGYGRKDPKITTIVHHIQDDRGTLYDDKDQLKEDRTLFFEWLIQYSPYKDIFRYRNLGETLDRNVLVCDVLHMDNVLVGGLISSRIVSEYTGMLKVFAGLVREKVDPSLAFYYTHRYQASGATLTPYTASSHTGISGSMGIKSVKNFITGNVTTKRKLYWETQTYESIHHAWWDKDDRSPQYGEGNNELNITDELKKLVAPQKNVSNPFVKVALNTIPLKEGIPALASILNNRVHKEVLNA